MKKEPIDWFTTETGVHVPIYDGESKSDALDRQFKDETKNIERIAKNQEAFSSGLKSAIFDKSNQTFGHSQDEINELIKKDKNELNKMNNFKNEWNNLSEEERYDKANKSMNKLLDVLDKEVENRGKLIPINDGYGIELSNGDIIYTDKTSNRIKREEDKIKKEKQKEIEENKKLLKDEYDKLIQRQDEEEKRRNEEKSRIEKEKEKRRKDIQKGISDFFIGTGVGLTIPKIPDLLKRK